MQKRVLAVVMVAAVVFSACTKSTAPQDTIPQPTDEIAQDIESDPTAENMATQCSSGLPVENGPLRIVTTVASVTSLVGQMVAGTDAIVDGIIPESANSHTYELTPADIEKIKQADVIIANGLGMEKNFGSASQTSKKDDAVYCELATAALDKNNYAYDVNFPQENGFPNPHVWMNPGMALRYLNSIRDAITSRTAGERETVDANYVKLSQQMMTLDKAMYTAVETIPVRNRTIFTFHNSLPYFASHFKFETGLVFQLPTFQDPTPVEVADAIAIMKTAKAPALIGNTEFPGAFMDEVAKGAGVKVITISDEDLPGKPGQADHTWGGMMRQSFTAIVEGLGGDASALKAVKSGIGAKDAANYPQ